jgi:probable phosphoglycerate mutase
VPVVEGTRIVLVRHGESQAQEDRIVAGHDGCTGLSDRGRQQVGALARRLAETGELAGATALYTSLMARAIETAEIVAPAIGVDEIVRTCDFCEHHPGAGDGLPWDEFDRRYPQADAWDRDGRRVPDSETWNEMQARVARGLDLVVERHPGETVVVCCHGGVVVHAMARWLDLSPRAIDRAWFQVTNASLTEWRFAPNPFDPELLPLELVRFNDHAHLATLGFQVDRTGA